MRLPTFVLTLGPEGVRHIVGQCALGQARKTSRWAVRLELGGKPTRQNPFAPTPRVIVKLEFGRSKKRTWQLNAVRRTLNGKIPTLRPTCFGQAHGALDWQKSGQGALDLQKAGDTFFTISGKLPPDFDWPNSNVTTCVFWKNSCRIRLGKGKETQI